MKHQVIIPQFLRNETTRKYIPQTLKIQKGDTITWINTDNESHHICFIKIVPDPTIIEVLDERLYLNPGEDAEIRFNYNCERIDYVCKLHRGEVNSIAIFAKDHKSMSNAQRLGHLRRIYDIKAPNLSLHLDGNG
jgi:plastocyanin